MPRLARAWRSLERFADGSRAAPALVAAALAVYALVSVVLPWRLVVTSDATSWCMRSSSTTTSSTRTLWRRERREHRSSGGLLEAGPLVAEIGAAALYALSILAWCAAARRLGPAAAIATAAALLLYPGYVTLFHRLSSDAVFAAAFALVAWLLARTLERPSAARAAALGAGVAALVLVRPVAQVLLLLALVPLFAGETWRARVRGSAAFVLVTVVPLLAWAGHNAVRADDFTLARGGGATLPLFRTFVADRIVEPENGPATRELERAVARDLLPFEPYRSYEIDLDRFFSSGSAHARRSHRPLRPCGAGTTTTGGSRRSAGRRCSRIRGPTRRGSPAICDAFSWPLYAPTPGAGETQGTRVPIADHQLPVPGEGEPIPSARQSSYITTPDQRIREVWTSPTEHHIVFSRPETRRAQPRSIGASMIWSRASRTAACAPTQSTG